MVDTLGPLLSADRKPPPPTPISFEDFLAWADEDQHAEWVDGEIIRIAPANLDHQDLIDFLNDLVKTYVRRRRLGRVILPDFLMRLPTRPSGRVPDLLFVATEHLDRLRDTYLDGPADLAVENLSPDSDARDRSEKFVEYEAAGIPEYWLIDARRRQAFFYRLGEGGHYHLAPTDAEGWYHSAVLPHFRLRVDWLWRRPLPWLAEVAGEIEEPERQDAPPG